MKLYNNINIKKYNSLNIDYLCKCLIEIDNYLDLSNLIIILNILDIKYIVIGNGSKIAFNDYYIDMFIIALKSSKKYTLNKNNELLVFAGDLLKEITTYLLNKNLGGFHKLSYIPASVSGAIYMNAGIKELSISKYVKYVLTIDKNNKYKIYNYDECKFDYRYSIFKDNNEVIILVLLITENIDKNIILKEIKNEYIKRINTQGYYKYSCGSLFKNNSKKAYEYISELKLNNQCINGLKFSSIHSNILINNANASCFDLLKFVNIIKENVYKKYNINLKLELNIIDVKK